MNATLSLFNRALLLTCIVFFSSSTSVAQTESVPRILVLGYECSIDNPMWTSQLVGFGVKNQLKQLLIDSLNSEIVDEKTIDKPGENNTLLNDSAKPIWMLAEGDINPDFLKNFSADHQIQEIYWVKIVAFAKPKSLFSFGPWSTQQTKSELTLQICRFSVANGGSHCAVGFAESSLELNAFLYQPIDTSFKKQDDFNQSRVGRLSNEALTKALSEFHLNKYWP